MIFILIINPGLIYLNIFVFLRSTFTINHKHSKSFQNTRFPFSNEIYFWNWNVLNWRTNLRLEPICQGISSCFFVVHFTPIFQYFSWVIRISPVTFHPKLKTSLFSPITPNHLNDKPFLVQNLIFIRNYERVSPVQFC